MLDDFDQDLEAAGFRMIRFADDFVILCKDKSKAEAADHAVRRSLKQLDLVVNPGKTRVVSFQAGFRYLGYLFVNALALDTAGKKTEIKNAASAIPPGSWLARLGRREPEVLADPAQLDTWLRTEDRESPQTRTEVGEPGTRGAVLFVTGEPCVLATRAGRVEIWRGDEKAAHFPWRGLHAVLLLGPHHLTGPAMRATLHHGVPVHFAAASGRYQGALWNAQPAQAGHQLWLKQLERFNNTTAAIDAARALVGARVRHLREVLRQYDTEARFAAQREELGQGLRRLVRAESLSELNGLEGAATRAWFAAVKEILPAHWMFEARRRHPATDPFNALLSLGYTVLYLHVDSLLRVDGLLPWAGFYHQGRGRHAALASDLMEPFRHMIERTALRATLRNQFAPDDFSQRPGPWLPPAGGGSPALSRLAVRTVRNAREIAGYGRTEKNLRAHPSAKPGPDRVDRRRGGGIPLLQGAMKVYLVCFDISDDRMRLRTGNLLLEYGERVQRSVFEVTVRSEAEYNNLLARLDWLAEQEGEKDPDVRFYHLCQRCRNECKALDGRAVARFPAAIIINGVCT